jgi:hypothetical protein
MGQLRHLGIEVRGTVINRFAEPAAPYGAYEYVQAASGRRKVRLAAARANDAATTHPPAEPVEAGASTES